MERLIPTERWKGLSWERKRKEVKVESGFFFCCCYGVSNWDRKQKRLTVSEKMIILVLDLLNLRCWQSVHVLQLET